MASLPFCPLTKTFHCSSVPSWNLRDGLYLTHAFRLPPTHGLTVRAAIRDSCRPRTRCILQAPFVFPHGNVGSRVTANPPNPTQRFHRVLAPLLVWRGVFLAGATVGRTQGLTQGLTSAFPRGFLRVGCDALVGSSALSRSCSRMRY